MAASDTDFREALIPNQATEILDAITFCKCLYNVQCSGRLQLLVDGFECKYLDFREGKIADPHETTGVGVIRHGRPRNLAPVTTSKRKHIIIYNPSENCVLILCRWNASCKGEAGMPLIVLVSGLG
jgi:hypothetical protein